MNKKLRDIYIKIGRSIFDCNDSLHVQQVENGFIFFQKYYESIDEMLPDIKSALEKSFLVPNE